MRNMYYHDPSVIDLQKMRADASGRAVGDRFHKPEEVTIHHHAVGTSCKNQKHEVFQTEEKRNTSV